MLTIKEIERASHGVILQGNSHQKGQGISIDSRTIQKGDIFFAITGNRFDGHDFLEEVIQKGACGVVVSRKVTLPFHVPVILVKDTTKALGQTAGFYRQRFKIPVIAVTGSTGKTTTKELIACILGEKFRVLKNIKTENNHIGVPLTIFRLTPAHDVLVCEFGTNQPGDIAWLSQITHPTIAVFTNIGESHLEKLKSPLGVFKEKSSLIQYLLPRGAVIFNADDFYLQKIQAMKMASKKISYALRTKAVMHASEHSFGEGCSLQFVLEKNIYRIFTVARHNIYNSLAAIGCGRLLGVGEERIKAALAKFRFCEGRQQVEKIGGVSIINDTYNANPISFRSAIDTLRSFSAKGRKILVCADMLELGKRAKQLHEELGNYIAQAPIDYVLATGENMRYTVERIRNAKRNNVYFLPSLEDIHQQLRKCLRADDVILIKGSRAMRMERTIDFLKKTLN